MYGVLGADALFASPQQPSVELERNRIGEHDSRDVRMGRVQNKVPFTSDNRRH
jgi:hypothetical protein